MKDRIPKPPSAAELRRLSTRARVIEEAKGKCVKCGEHVSTGGIIAVERRHLELLCKRCNGVRATAIRVEKKNSQAEASLTLR